MKNYKAKYLIKVDGKYNVKFKSTMLEGNVSLIEFEVDDLDNAIEFINSLEVVASTLRHKDSLEIFLREFKEMTCEALQRHSCLEFDGMFKYSIIPVAVF